MSLSSGIPESSYSLYTMSVWNIGKILTWESNSWVSTRHCCTLQGLPTQSGPETTPALSQLQQPQDGMWSCSKRGWAQPQASHALLSWVSHLKSRHSTKSTLPVQASTRAVVPGSSSPTAAMDHPNTVWYWRSWIWLLLGLACSSKRPHLTTNNQLKCTLTSYELQWNPDSKDEFILQRTQLHANVFLWVIHYILVVSNYRNH